MVACERTLSKGWPFFMPVGKLNTVTLKDGRKAIIIRTSDRISFKKCRRSWSWSSHLKENWGSKNLASPLWFGSAIHYALEDYHGYQKFDKPADAFRAYCIATSKQHLRDLPYDAAELFKLGTAIMSYYTDHWLRHRKADQTFWLDGVPQVEVDLEIEVPLDDHPHLKELAAYHSADCVLYRGTIDRMAIDEYGRLWVVEYKTAKVFEHNHYQTDPQVTTYVWAAKAIYPNHEVAGVIYQQFGKKIPEQPKILASGKVSTASNMITSATLYRDLLDRIYGSAENAPEANRDYLTNLMISEDEHKDRYIVRTLVTRNDHMCEMEAQKILLELEDMLNPDLPLYPAPTRDCSRMCSFLGPCVSFDDGSDWEYNLEHNFAKRDSAADRMWRRRMPSPEKMLALREAGGEPDLEEMQARLQSLPHEAREAIERGEEEIGFTFNM